MGQGQHVQADDGVDGDGHMNDKKREIKLTEINEKMPMATTYWSVRGQKDVERKIQEPEKWERNQGTMMDYQGLINVVNRLLKDDQMQSIWIWPTPEDNVVHTDNCHVCNSELKG